MIKLNFPEYNSSRKNYDIVNNQREKLNYYISLLYKDRSKINLLEFRRTERDVFLNYVAICKGCTKKKRLINFYSPELGTITDNCNKCEEDKEVYSILLDLFKD